MNFNTSLYSNAIPGISKEFGVSTQAARVGAAVFLVAYAFGCELWAPWSEEIGRKPILQASLFLVNIWQIPVALAPNFATIIVCRILGGLSSAGGSVTLGMIADMWEADDQQYAVAFVVFSSVGGSILGPIVGGFSEAYLDWRWSIWLQLIFGGFVQILHLIIVPETRSTVMMNNIAQKRRKSSVDPNVWGPIELTPWKERFSAKEILITWYRPFKMFATEPIVLVLSLLSGFSDALIFMFIQSFSLVYKQWGFSIVQQGLAFIPIGVGYILAYISFIPAIRRNMKERRENPDDEHAQYESRLKWLLWTAPCLPAGLIFFAWTSTGPPIPWIVSMVASAIVGIANYAIYMATIDYMIAAYGPYSASATGGNGWSRDFLAGVLTLPATPFFTNIGGSKHLAYASTILCKLNPFDPVSVTLLTRSLVCIAFILVIAVYVIYWKGPVLRKRSPFAQQLEEARSGLDAHGRRLSKLPTDEEKAPATTPGPNRPRPAASRGSSYARAQQELRVRQATGSNRGTPRASPRASRRNSFEKANGFFPMREQQQPDLHAAATMAAEGRANEGGKFAAPTGSKKVTPTGSKRTTPTASRRGSYNETQLHSKNVPGRGGANDGSGLTTIPSAAIDN